MRRLITNPVARALPALLVVTAMVACASNDTVSTTGAPSTTETTSTTAASATTGTGSSTEAPAATETTTSTVTTPPVGSCNEAAVREAIANSDAVADVSFEFTYLKCAEGFGWAEILGDIGEAATVLFAGSGTEVELLNLGTSVCTTDSGIPADVAAQLAPDPRHPFGDCP